MFLRHFLCALVACSCAGAVDAATLVQWDFNASDAPVAESPSTGTYNSSVNQLSSAPSIAHVGGTTGSSFGNGFVTADSSSLSLPNNRSSDPAAAGLDSAMMAANFPQSGSDKSAGVQIGVNLTDVTGVMLNFDSLIQSSASRYHQLQYSLGGGAFVDHALLDAAGNNQWVIGRSYSFGSLLDNQADVRIRLVSTLNGGTSYTANVGTVYSGSNGQLRLDMVTLSGTIVPEPTLVGAAAMLLPLLGRRRAQ